MSVRKIRNSWWIDFRFNGTRYRKRSPECSQAGAKIYEVVLRHRLAKGDPVDEKKAKEKSIPTFREFSDQWYNTYVVTNNKPSEQNGKGIILKVHLLPFFGGMKLDEITSMKIEEYKTLKSTTKLAAKTINNHLSVLGKCLRMAQEWGELREMPKIKLLKVPPQRFDFLSPEESQKLLLSIDNPKYYAMVLIALKAGLRLGELLALHWADVDFERRLLIVRHSIVDGIMGTPKNNRERYIPLINDVCESLERVQRSEGLIFSRRDGQPFKRYTLRYNLHKFARKAGIRRIGWHTLRHTFASDLVTGGAILKAVQELLGHSDIRMTMRYSHLASSTLRQAIEVLEIQPRLLTNGQPVVNTAITTV